MKIDDRAIRRATVEIHQGVEKMEREFWIGLLIGLEKSFLLSTLIPYLESAILSTVNILDS